MSQPYRAPRGSFEVLASLYGDVLGVERVGLDDSFFELGGDEHTLPLLVDSVSGYFGLPVSELVSGPQFQTPRQIRFGARFEF